MLPLPEKALSESMEKGGRKMQGKKEGSGQCSREKSK